jgi:cold shock CspA family protein
MARSKETFSKKEVRKKKEKKKKEKEKKRLARKELKKDSNADDMIAYVDEYGRITSTPPDKTKRVETNLEDIEVSVPKKQSPYDDQTSREGKVKYFNESKGYGFIYDSETQEAIFVHINNTIEEIKEGDMVSFEIEKGKKGPTAIQVKLIT